VAVQPTHPFVAKIWVFPQKQFDAAKARAATEGIEPVVFQAQGAYPIPRLTRLTVRLSIDRCTVEPESGELVWAGEIVSLGFRATPAAGIPEGSVLMGAARVEIAGLGIGTVIFNVAVGAMTGSDFALGRAVRTGFICYAGHDRWLVLGRVQGLERAGIEVFM